ncbi:hypothetical protein [Pseudomonas sp. dw_358]|uniref:hypothetical protein n=1 Tax=Pseudomonas sp. dw_358 TaxID=2720083 RepID=UPI001BD4D0E0|nr:hypothetical protein [Pseudomonas sp. dw_358]
MSLLSDLLNHMPPTVANSEIPGRTERAPDHPRLGLVKRPAAKPATYTNAASATPEWRQARDQYINHVMACPGCHAPTARHCAAGAGLRTTYDNTPMENRP